MGEVKVAPYGSWESPITSDLIVSATVGLGQTALDGGDTYWIELRPSEGGRNCIVRRAADGSVSDITPAGFNARTRVHEYGGGDFVVREGTVYFSNFADQRLYEQRPGEAPRPLTPEKSYRYSDCVVDARRGRLLAVREDHTVEGREAVNAVVALRADGSVNEDGGAVIVGGNDFYSSPRLSPDGRRLAWLTWNHPNMPWDGCELWVGELNDDGTLGESSLVAGGEEESVFQPEWSPEGVLYFVSDRSNWWNIYRVAADGTIERAHEEREAEFATPQWLFAMSTYSFESAERIVCAYNERGTWRLARLGTRDGRLEPIETPYTEISYVRAAPGRVVFRGGSPTERLAVVEVDLASGRVSALKRASEVALDEGYISTPRAVEFPTEGGVTAHAFFYAPRNKDFKAPEGERPPLLVKCHGGPTAATTTTLRLETQYWTSRGVAVLDVNYGGSTGYGREYRQRLNGQWGVVDVDDCVNGAKYLVGRGEVDGARCVITGGSAGGYTTLNALTFRDTFKAGASHFGISDLTVFVGDTHKFESRYLDRLIGPYPERADLYFERSSINFTDRLSCPVIFFQGLEDKVVPPNQAELMVEALRRKRLPVAYVAFEGEQHGFRRAENIKRALDGELYFYSRVFGFEMADKVEPVEIENL
ncbi:MAG TPA: prolyl oligopeptidase family serine peptidase [Pyrinomonadaceae bacterium]|nr:prolyl oligopeptidase family serine peptidase [Pyrinomonadaceae bacterium]